MNNAFLRSMDSIDCSGSFDGDEYLEIPQRSQHQVMSSLSAQMQRLVLYKIMQLTQECGRKLFERASFHARQLRITRFSLRVKLNNLNTLIHSLARMQNAHSRTHARMSAHARARAYKSVVPVVVGDLLCNAHAATPPAAAAAQEQTSARDEAARS